MVGVRCEVRVPSQPTRRATVRYNGSLEGAKGLWIGVQYDEPRGKNDGSYVFCCYKTRCFLKQVYNFPFKGLYYSVQKGLKTF